MFVGYRHCKKCGKPLMGLFDGALCDECEKAEQEPKSIIREAIEDYVCNYLTDTAKSQEILNALQDMEQEPILDKLTEIIEPLRHLAFDEMSDVEWQIFQVIDKYAEQEPCDECRNKRTSFCGNCKEYDEFEIHESEVDGNE